MRAAFVRTLVELAEEDPRVLLLTGDLGFMALEPFAERFSDRFINVGVAEQNMVGLATGLAEAGFVPYVYSIATFATLRPYEFIRNGPIAHNLPVRIVGMGGGFEYGAAGSTHHALEDVAVMRAQPGITVIAPADHRQAVTALRACHRTPGPIYYRLGKNDRVTVTGLDGRFELGHAQRVREGGDLLVITMGAIASEAIEAASNLSARGIECEIVVVAHVHPPPADDLRRALERFQTVLTVEAHYTNGGLGSIVSEIAAQTGLRCRVVRCGVDNAGTGLSGDQNYIHGLVGLGPKSLALSALTAVTGN